MELVLLLHIAEFDPTLGRFRSEAFENSSEGGISVFERTCAVAASGSVCDHARRFYRSVTTEPPVYWEFDSSILPSGHQLAQSPSNTGDACHHDILEISDNRAKKFFKKQHPGVSKMIVCDLSEHRSFTLPEAVAMKAVWLASQEKPEISEMFPARPED